MSDDTVEEHEITATSVREYKGHITLDMLPESEEYVDHSWRFEEETKRTYECVCGDKFRKKETAVGHLEDEAEDDETEELRYLIKKSIEENKEQYEKMAV